MVFSTARFQHAQVVAHCAERCHLLERLAKSFREARQRDIEPGSHAAVGTMEKLEAWRFRTP